MEITEINLSKQLTTTLFNPSPHRYEPDEVPVSDRQLHLEHTCDECGYILSFKTCSFKKHCNSEFTNLTESDHDIFNRFIKKNNLDNLSFLDFYCPKCKQPTVFLFECGNSGYWGCFFYEIKKVFVIKK